MHVFLGWLTDKGPKFKTESGEGFLGIRGHEASPYRKYIKLYSPYMMVEKKTISQSIKTSQTIIRISTQ